MFVYSRSINIHASGFNRLLEAIFCLLLAMAVFCLQKAVRMLEEVVVGWREVRWLWQTRQNSAAWFVQLLKPWCAWALSCRRTGPAALTSADCGHGSFQRVSSICWAHFSDIVVLPGFRKLEWIRLAGDHQCPRPFVFWCKFGLGKCFGASSWSSHWAGHHWLYKIHFSSHITIRSRNGLLLLKRIREVTLQNDDFILIFQSAHEAATYRAFSPFQFASNAEWM